MESANNNLDEELLLYIQNCKRNFELDRVMISLSEIGNSNRVWIIIGIILLLRPKTRDAGLAEILAVSLSTAAARWIKNLTKRLRPFMEIPHPPLLIPAPDSYSFPSGHSAASFAGAWAIFNMFSELGAPALLLAALISYSRLYLFVHYPTDVLGGIVLGIICGDIAINIVEKKYINILKTN